MARTGRSENGSQKAQAEACGYTTFMVKAQGFRPQGFRLCYRHCPKYFYQLLEKHLVFIVQT
jgi:hypothetical protein